MLSQFLVQDPVLELSCSSIIPMLLIFSFWTSRQPDLVSSCFSILVCSCNEFHILVISYTPADSLSGYRYRSRGSWAWVERETLALDCFAFSKTSFLFLLLALLLQTYNKVLIITIMAPTPSVYDTHCDGPGLLLQTREWWVRGARKRRERQLC